MTGFLDKLPPAVRHALFSLAALLVLAGLDYAQANYTTWNLSPVLGGLIALVIPVLIAYVTPITTQYGAGSAVDTGAVGPNGTQDA